MDVKMMLVTPKMAKEWLEKNTGNYRRFERARQKRYAIDMMAGNWDENGETIKFNGTDKLVDGQHRLGAVVESGVAVKMLVVFGVKSAMNVDTGRPRTVADWLRHNGIKNGLQVAAVCRLCVIHNRGLWGKQSCGADFGSNQEVIEYADNHAESLQDAVRLAGHSKVIATHSIMASIMHLGAGEKSPSQNELCSWFVKSLAEGESLTNEEPVFHLRNRLLLNDRKSSKLSYYMQRMLMTVAWNKTVNGESCKTLRLDLSGPKKQTPPYCVEVAR